MTDDTFPPLKPLTHRIRISYRMLKHFSWRPKMAFLGRDNSDLVATILSVTGVVIWFPAVLVLILIRYLGLPFQPLVVAFRMTGKQQKNIEDYLENEKAVQ